MHVNPHSSNHDPNHVWIAIRNVFRNVILAHVNTAIDIRSAVSEMYKKFIFILWVHYKEPYNLCCMLNVILPINGFIQ